MQNNDLTKVVGWLGSDDRRATIDCPFHVMFSSLLICKKALSLSHLPLLKQSFIRYFAVEEGVESVHSKTYEFDQPQTHRAKYMFVTSCGI